MQLIQDDIDLSAYMDGPEAMQIRPASDWIGQTIDHFHKPFDAKRWAKLPWIKMHNIFEFRPGEVTIIGGINGHGKSLVWGHVILDLCNQGEKVCVASLEMKPYRTMVRMARQALNDEQPSIPHLKGFGKWTDNKLWLYDYVGMCRPEKMIAVIRYAKDKYNIDHFVIDNLTKVIPGDVGDAALNGQKDFVNQLTALASELNIHIHLVMHVRKGATEDEMPNKMSLKGSGSITDMVDNVFIIWRNKSKERQIREGNNAKMSDPDVIILLDKQRNGESDDNEGSFMFWFSRTSLQLLEDRHARPKQYNLIQPLHMEHNDDYAPS